MCEVLNFFYQDCDCDSWTIFKGVCLVSIPFNQRRNIQEYFLIQCGIPEECVSVLSALLHVLKLLRPYLLVCFVTKLQVYNEKSHDTLNNNS